MIERMMNGSPGRASSQELVDRVDEGFIATDEFGVPYSQYVSETPYVESEAFPEGVANADVEISLEKNVEFPKEQSSTIGFIRVNGVEYPIVGFESTSAGFGRNGDDVLWQEVEWDDCEGSYREPTLNSFSQLRPGYKGGNVPNLYKSCEPCSKVNPKDVAKRRAKNKAARKNKRK